MGSRRRRQQWYSPSLPPSLSTTLNFQPSSVIFSPYWPIHKETEIWISLSLDKKISISLLCHLCDKEISYLFVTRRNNEATQIRFLRALTSTERGWSMIIKNILLLKENCEYWIFDNLTEKWVLNFW